jgi:hypothetical protein
MAFAHHGLRSSLDPGRIKQKTRHRHFGSYPRSSSSSTIIFIIIFFLPKRSIAPLPDSILG